MQAGAYLIGLVGHPVSHSLSPPLYRAAYEHVGLAGEYRLIDLTADRLEDGIKELAATGFAGFNVTIPHKEKVFALCQQRSAEAAALGAVNCVVIDGGRLVGHNTDRGGFRLALESCLPVAARMRVALIVGAGGAARAALGALIELGLARVVVVARNPGQAATMVEAVLAGAARPAVKVVDLSLAGMSWMPDVLINCTPIGMGDGVAPEWLAQLLKWMSPEGLVFDMVYRPDGGQTALCAEAHRLRLLCCDGSEMLVQQAKLAFELFTGKAIPVEVLRQALSRARAGHKAKDGGWV